MPRFSETDIPDRKLFEAIDELGTAGVFSFAVILHRLGYDEMGWMSEVKNSLDT